VPTYQYVCTECGEPLEAVQSFTDADLTTCPICGGKLRKVFSAVGVVFKGSGFYRNDSRTTAGSKASAGEGSSSSSDGASSGSGTTTESGKADKKPTDTKSSSDGSSTAKPAASTKPSGSGSAA
jgi:putative FmdB family regulatory protein